MDFLEDVSLKGKTTMRIGGTAKYFAELTEKDDVTKAIEFASEKGIPLIVLGGGSNTIFADGVINGLVVRISAQSVVKNDNTPTSTSDGLRGADTVTVEAGKNLPQLINELAVDGLDLSPLTGILGTVGGAIYGNAGQGPKGIWIDEYVESVDVFVDGAWNTFSKDDCDFSYRESVFKTMSPAPIIWSTTLRIPENNPEDIQAEIDRLLQRRIDTQPHAKTAGSCFKAVGEVPAWQLIDAAGLRDTASGDLHISKKHANFLINDGEATFQDAVNVVNTIEEGIEEGLEVEMQFIQEDGSLLF